MNLVIFIGASARGKSTIMEYLNDYRKVSLVHLLKYEDY